MIGLRIRHSLLALTFSILASSTAVFIGEGQSAPAGPMDHDTPARPIVKFTSPESNSTYSWNSLVSYSVVVTYQGKSTEYQEIPSNQVLLQTTYLPDLSEIPAAANPASAPVSAGLLAIIRSNCVGCHEFKAKAMGPSFGSIAARYPNNPATLDTLSRHIREGSNGLWGQISMPPHPELSEEQARAMALWIAKEAANPNVTDYVGTDGAIRMASPASPGPNAGLIVTASYTVTASSADREQAPQGHATVILRGK